MSWNSTVSKEVAAWFGGVVGEKYNWLTESHMQEDIKDGWALFERNRSNLFFFQE